LEKLYGGEGRNAIYFLKPTPGQKRTHPGYHERKSEAGAAACRRLICCPAMAILLLGACHCCQRGIFGFAYCMQ